MLKSVLVVSRSLLCRYFLFASQLLLATPVNDVVFLLLYGPRELIY